MAKVLETWNLWDSKQGAKWDYLVSCTNKKQVESFRSLCWEYNFNGCAFCDGSAKALKNEEWFIKDYSKIPLISYKRFREFLATL